MVGEGAWKQDTGKFCRETLCNTELVDYVNSTFVCWGGDISYPDAYRLSNRYGHCTMIFSAYVETCSCFQ